MKEAFSVKLQTENLSLFFFFFFLLKIEIKQNPGCPNKEYNSIFEHINHITRAYPRSKKKICIDRWLWKYYCVLEESEQRWTNVICSKHIWGIWGSVPPSGKFWYFYSHWSLEAVFPALKLTHNCYIIINILFS